MNQKDYMNTMTRITATDSLKQQILSKVSQESDQANLSAYEVKVNYFRFSIRKMIAVSCALVVCLFSTLVYAGVIDLSNIYKFVFGDNTGYIEQHIRPIESVNDNQSSNAIENRNITTIQDNAEQSFSETNKKTYATEYVFDGIQMKLLSAIHDDKSLRIFAAVTDLTGDRLSAETKFDYWELDQGHGGNISVVDYNKDTRTAILLITSLGDDHQGKANLEINSFTTGRQFIEGQAENKVNLFDLLQQQSPSALSQDEVFVGGGAIQSKEDERLFKTTKLLGFGNMSINFDNINWCTISNIGFVDGYLHIQTKTLSDNINDLASVNLIDKDNNVLLNGHLFISYTDKEHRYQENNMSSYAVYKDMIYKDITMPEQLKDLYVSIDYMLEGQTNEASWQFSFEIPEKASMIVTVMKNLNINGKDVMVDAVSLSPSGVSIKLPTSCLADYQQTDQASIVYQDSTVILLENITTTGYEGETILTFDGKIIEIEKVQSIVINGDVLQVMTYQGRQ